MRVLPGQRWRHVLLLVSMVIGVTTAMALAALPGWQTGAFFLLIVTLILGIAWSAVLHARTIEAAATRLEAEHVRHLRAVESFRQSEARFRHLIENAADAILVYNHELRLIEANRQAIELFGYDRQELMTLSIKDLELPVAEIDQPSVQELLLDGMAATVNSIYRRKDGATVSVEARISLFQVAGRPVKMVLMRDMTERNRAEEALRDQRNLLRDVLENIPTAVYRKGLDGRYLGCNAMFARKLGVSSPEDIVGRTDEELALPPALAELYAMHEREVMQTGQPQLNIEERITGAAGPMIYLNSRVPVRDDAGRMIAILGVCTDITERKRLEERFMQAQKLEAIGRLAGGVAHDFNNLLTIINGYSQLAVGELCPGNPIREWLNQVVEAGVRATGLTGQLLAYSRRQVLQPKRLDLNQLVTNLERMLRRLIGEDIDLRTDLAEDLAKVKVDPGQFEQVLMNLAINARDAMPEGGRLTIRTCNISDGDLPCAPDTPSQPGGYVLLEVRDTGIGMDSATKARVFEPFFTTKEIGRGTGLGLAIVHGIVKQSCALINVDSQPGVGSAFQIFIPAAEGHSQPDARSSAVDVPSGSETILLVEDEFSVRSLTRSLLKTCGYRVIDAAGGAEALEIVRQISGPVDLLLTDVVMPGMNGRQLAERLRTARPDLKVLYVSGYPDDAIVRRGIHGSDAAFLAKPFTLPTLAAKVRAILDSAPSSLQAHAMA